MHYDVVYDVARYGYPGWIGVFGGLTFGIAAATFCRFRRLLRPASRRWIPCAFVPLSLLWLVGWIAATLPAYYSLRSALQRGDCTVAEGVVTDFHPMPANGKGHESFSVNDVRFTYSDFIITPGFHQTNYRGGPMRSGLHVRIHYRGSDIARLEIAQEHSTATSNQTMKLTTTVPMSWRHFLHASYLSFLHSLGLQWR